MKVKVPNYLYPLATSRQLQWTRQVVKGEATAKRAITPRRFNPAKKEIIRDMVKNKKTNVRFGKQQKTRDTVNATLKANLPNDPMRAPDPRPGNAMHISNTKTAYKIYQS